MKAKNTSAAPDSTPAMPYFAGSAPVAHDSSDCDHACAPPPSAGIAGGTNGDRLAASKYVNPTTITNSTMPTLITVNTLLRSEEHTSELQSLMRISYAVLC